MILFPMGQIFPKIPNMKGKNGSDEDFRIVSFETTIRIRHRAGDPEQAAGYSKTKAA